MKKFMFLVFAGMLFIGVSNCKETEMTEDITPQETCQQKCVNAEHTCKKECDEQHASDVSAADACHKQCTETKKTCMEACHIP